jgi:hypothetical protein
MDINVNVKFDEKFVNALSDIADCLAAVSMARAGNTNARLPEKTVGLTKEERLKQMEAVMFEDEERPAKPVEKAKAAKDTKTEEKPLTGEPVSPAKAKEINEAIKTPSKEDLDMQAKRAELKSIMAKATKDGKTEAVKALLHDMGVQRLSQLPDEKVEEAIKKAGEL